jgi:VWFA-related protein
VALRIASPTEGSYVSGPTRLVAVIDPPSAAREVTQIRFFAGPQQVCTLTGPPFECEWDAGERVAEHQIRAVAVLRSGVQIVQTVRTKGVAYAEAVDVDVVRVTAVVTDRRGRFVKGLKRSDFTVFEDDVTQKISHFASENIPLEMVTALDVSSSMRDALPTVKSAAKRFLAGLQPGDQVTVLAFNDSIFMPARRATDQATRERAIDRIGSWGGTALYDVIIKAVELLGRQTGRRSIVLFTDGDDQSSHAPLEVAIAHTEASDATIYAIGQGRAVRARRLQQLLQRLSGLSGGQAFFTNDPDQLDAVFEQILDELRHQYLISYPVPSGVRDGKWHSIRVEAAGGKYKVRARQGYRLTKS